MASNKKIRCESFWEVSGELAKGLIFVTFTVNGILTTL